MTFGDPAGVTKAVSYYFVVTLPCLREFFSIHANIYPITFM